MWQKECGRKSVRIKSEGQKKCENKECGRKGVRIKSEGQKE